MDILVFPTQLQEFLPPPTHLLSPHLLGTYPPQPIRPMSMNDKLFPGNGNEFEAGGATRASICKKAPGST